MKNIQTIVKEAEEKGEIVRPALCETCQKKKPLVRHHRDYSKPLVITWLCHSCHRQEHCDNKELKDPNNTKKVVSAAVSDELKRDFKIWWTTHGKFETESEALRWLVRTATNDNVEARE